MKKTLLLFVVTSIGSFAQPIGLGVKGGVPFTDAFDTVSNPAGVLANTDTKRYIVGPMIELRLPAGLAIEADALYTRVNFNSALTAATSTIFSVTDSNSWEFPVLLKKKFGGVNAVAASARPFVGAGVSFRHLSGLKSLPAYVTGNRSNEVDSSNTGFVIGGGVEFKLLFLRVAPELRWTRWGSDNFVEGVTNVFRTNRNQGQFLIGLYF